MREELLACELLGDSAEKVGLGSGQNPVLWVVVGYNMEMASSLLCFVDVVGSSTWEDILDSIRWSCCRPGKFNIERSFN